mgnify:CR=1 FL=1
MLILIDTYKHFHLNPRTIKNSNTTVELLKTRKKMVKIFKGCASYRKLRRHDIYRRLINYNSDNGYRLHQANHIIDVEVGRVPDTTNRFINI